MQMNEVIQLIIFILLLIFISPLTGKYMAMVFIGEKHFMIPVFGWLEKRIYNITGIKNEEEMNWKTYLYCVIIFNLLGFIILFLLQIYQTWLPLNPEKLPNVSWHLAFNTAVSFMTNTNWQSGSGEITMSYFVQMVGLTVQNFVSAATGIAVALALMRGLTRKSTEVLGNFWTDITRTVLYVLLPISIILAVVLTGQGVVQNLSHYVKATTLQGTGQIIPMVQMEVVFL
jgi:K+-transporting ATPase ATPase A chain